VSRCSQLYANALLWFVRFPSNLAFVYRRMRRHTDIRHTTRAAKGYDEGTPPELLNVY
jgi:hypothetical protein